MRKRREGVVKAFVQFARIGGFLGTLGAAASSIA
jgi:hypothetical protein